MPVGIASMPVIGTKKKCFVLMPFRVKDVDKSKYQDGHWNQVYKGLIEPAAIKAGLDCSRDDQDVSSRQIVDGILRKIEAADIILCDLSSHNPNVFWELGWKFRADRPFVLMKDDLTDYPFDVSGQNTLSYSHGLQPIGLIEETDKLANALKSTLELTERPYSFVRHLGISLGAIKAADSGDVTSQMFLSIQSQLDKLLASPANSTRAFAANERRWPELSRKAIALLNNALAYLSAETAETLASPSFVGKFETFTKEMEAYRSKELQCSLIDKSRRYIYHDFPGLIGKIADNKFNDGTQQFDTLFESDFGAMVWADRNTNREDSPLPPSFKRLTLGIFSYLRDIEVRIFVEVHQEQN
jgi:hypothetical protein